MNEERRELYVDTYSIIAGLLKAGDLTHLTMRDMTGFVPYALECAKRGDMWRDYDSIVVHLTEESVKKIVAKYSNLLYFALAGIVCLKVDSSTLPDPEYADDRIRQIVSTYARTAISNR